MRPTGVVPRFWLELGAVLAGLAALNAVLAPDDPGLLKVAPHPLFLPALLVPLRHGAAAGYATAAVVALAWIGSFFGLAGDAARAAAGSPVRTPILLAVAAAAAGEIRRRSAEREAVARDELERADGARAALEDQVAAERTARAIVERKVIEAPATRRQAFRALTAVFGAPDEDAVLRATAEAAIELAEASDVAIYLLRGPAPPEPEGRSFGGRPGGTRGVSPLGDSAGPRDGSAAAPDSPELGSMLVLRAWRRSTDMAGADALPALAVPTSESEGAPLAPPAGERPIAAEGLLGLAVRERRVVSVRDLAAAGPGLGSGPKQARAVIAAPILAPRKAALAVPFARGTASGGAGADLWPDGETAEAEIPVVLGAIEVRALPFLKLTADAERVLGALGEAAGRAVEAARQLRRVREQSPFDDALGIHRYSFFAERLAEEFARSRRYGSPLAVLLIEVEGFDDIPPARRQNVLRTVALILRSTVRSVDATFAYRDARSFAVLLPSTDAEGGAAVRDRVATEIERMGLEPYREPGIPLRFAVGVAAYREDMQSPADLRAAAEDASAARVAREEAE